LLSSRVLTETAVQGRTNTFGSSNVARYSSVLASVRVNRSVIFNVSPVPA
jgi:hypothetical protein